MVGKRASGIAARRSPCLRTICLLLHRYVGLLLAGFLVMAGVTGSVIAFQEELEGWLNPELFTTTSRGAYLSPSRLQAQIAAADPRMELNYFLFNPPVGRTIVAYVRPLVDPATTQPYDLGFDQVFLDPVTGAIQGKRLYGACCLARQHLLPFLYELHRELTAGDTGTIIMGVIACLWTIDCFIGFYLTLPRSGPFLAKWRISWRIKRGAGSHRLILDWHRASGLWLWLALFLIAGSGVYLTLEQQIFRPILSLFSPLKEPALETAAKRLRPPRDTAKPRLSLDAAIRLAAIEAKRRNWDLPPTAIFDAAAFGAYGVYFFPASNDRGTGLGTPIVFLDDRSGAVIREDLPGEGSVGDVMVQAQFPLHSGQIGGLAGRIIVSLLGWVVVGLSVTGVVIWWRKRQAARRGRKRQPRAAAVRADRSRDTNRQTV
ncbi:MAG TPA: PepSY-associated TM helix domain-containing protein [Dongiaceae bacterium]|nr:PepSY-associated TM helix domain-containing protein [Dongiaceae bacterium]